MKSYSISIKFIFLFTLICFFSSFSGHKTIFAQGYNDNEWIFGNCGSQPNTYLSFGKGGTATVKTLSDSIQVGPFNNTIAIDPITGQPLFFSNGELVYDFSSMILQGVTPGLNGDFEGHQKVATGFLEYDPAGNKLFYIFYISRGGQLQYSLVDMNAPGQAAGNERPLGEITQKDQPIGPAQGAVLVVKTPASPSYLISFNGGNIVSQRIDATPGALPQVGQSPIPFTPKSMVFDPERGELVLVSENPSDDILVLDFDSSTGNFSNPRPIIDSGNSDTIGGVTFSPDDAFIYFSRGENLYRVLAADLTATPELIPFSKKLAAVYDIKVGPDGNLYYIYEEVVGGPQLIGRVTNPNEPDLALVSLEEDPFAGTDFCGKIFPTFAPNASINPIIDFTWSPRDPCANNPIQLTSVITPENYRPVSFSWAFNPPLTDANGDTLALDYSQEHFLVPSDAAQGTEINVTLTVTFADGTILNQPHTIPLTANDLQANFTPSDTTLCESCFDLDPLLEAQAGGGAGGGTGGGAGGGGAGGGTSYEYFWSNKRDEGWIPKGPNQICKPGLYWALVREPGSSCYAYAEIRVKMWDVEDQTNNIWYFGDGSGLDFNPDPTDSTAPTPRPLAAPHTQNIPAGTNTISDQTGQVLFFTDGQSVWDLNGNLMANGGSIGGDNTASQSVLAVPVPEEQTLFYLFTTQASATGTNEVKFSLVDIKAENPTGVGNVVSKDNFLFSPSTEQTAGFTAGDTTWVMFHELGNNTFRAYPVSANGIGQPVMSSVGSNHGFNSAPGTMKFSPDGTKLAVTISDGGTNRVEIFDFDPATGQLTEYARLELGSTGDVYGLEFSNDSDRIFVSYRNGGPGIEEFSISSGNNSSTPACPACFGTATTREALENCILSTRAALTGTSGLDLGALQIGPNGAIYAAVVGSNLIGQINAGTGCSSPSSFTTNGVDPLTGNTNLGLPSFIQNSGSSIPEPALSTPATICLDPIAGSSGLFDGGGEPDIDSYFWTITAEDGTVILSNFGGPGDQFQTLDQSFTAPGKYTVDLRVDRCAEVEYFTDSEEIIVVAPPTLTLVDDVTLCAGNSVTLTAIDGYDPTTGIYDFQWVNAAGVVFGNVNSNSITIDQESIYTVTVNYRASTNPDTPSCPSVKSVFAGPAFEFDLNQSATEICFEDTVVRFAPDTPISGEWFYTRNGDPTRVLIGKFFELELRINRQLPSPGIYEIFFIAEDPILPGCKIEKQVDLVVHALPSLTAIQANPASSCSATDGSLTITMQTAASSVTVVGTSFNIINVAAGEVLPPITGLAAGIYTIEAKNNFCTFSSSVIIENANPPVGFDYTVNETEETCTATGVKVGVLTINFTSSPQSGSYEIVRQEDGALYNGTFTSTTQVPVDLPHGTYLVNIIDPTGCNIPDVNSYKIEEKLEVVYSVPTSFSSCGSYSFAPISPTPLNYTMIDPNGVGVSVDLSGNFTLTKSGIYTITGTDPSGANCPKTTEINATITSPITISVSAPKILCQVGVSYEAILPTGTDKADFLFFWRDELGIIVGRRFDFVPSRAGNYSLEVQPISGGLCPSSRVPFTAITLDPRLSVTIDVQPFCSGQTSTLLEVKANFSTVKEIEWFQVVGGTKTRIPSLNDSSRVNLSIEGIYEVILRSATGCEIGRASGSVIKSTIIPPILPSSIAICAAEGVTQTINPGTYDQYVWKLEGNEVSRDSTFTPTKPGKYELTVSDNLGCEYIETIDVLEDCALKISLPNAMILGDSTRNFILYANEYIDDAEVFIFNRWGELIFYCTHENISPGTPFCPWDGMVNGKFVQLGTYAVKVKFTSQNQNKTESITKAITILQ
jgi:hypothetical protein